MELHFRNQFHSTLFVAITFFSPDDCRNYGSWGTKGWWRIDPGDQKYVINTNNSYAYFYAEAITGEVWNGPYGPMYVYPNAFQSCLNIGSTAARPVGTRPVQITSDRNFVNLKA